MIAPYIALAATGLPAAARLGGVLRWYLLWDVLVTCALKLAFIHYQHWDEPAHRMVWPLYYPLWRVTDGIRVVIGAAVVLTRCRPRMWPVLPALVLHVWAGGYADVWPGSWLQAEIHGVAFCCLLFGLTMAAELWTRGEGKGGGVIHRSGRYLPANPQTCALALLFIGTATGYYSAPWAMWTRPYTMHYQSACYLALAIAGPVAPPSAPPVWLRNHHKFASTRVRLPPSFPPGDLLACRPPYRLLQRYRVTGPELIG